MASFPKNEKNTCRYIWKPLSVVSWTGQLLLLSMPKKGKGGKGGKKAAEADPDDLGCSPDNLKKNYERICKYGPVALNRLPPAF